jgi:hypothetical protein
MDFDAFCFPGYVPLSRDHNGLGKDPCHWIGSNGKHKRVSGIGECTREVLRGDASRVASSKSRMPRRSAADARSAMR